MLSDTASAQTLDNGDWGCIYLGDISAFPSDLVGATIVV